MSSSCCAFVIAQPMFSRSWWRFTPCRSRYWPFSEKPCAASTEKKRKPSGTDTTSVTTPADADLRVHACRGTGRRRRSTGAGSGTPRWPTAAATSPARDAAGRRQARRDRSVRAHDDRVDGRPPGGGCLIVADAGDRRERRARGADAGRADVDARRREVHRVDVNRVGDQHVHVAVEAAEEREVGRQRRDVR